MIDSNTERLSIETETSRDGGGVSRTDGVGVEIEYPNPQLHTSNIPKKEYTIMDLLVDTFGEEIRKFINEQSK